MKSQKIKWPDLQAILKEEEKGEAAVEFYEVSDDAARATRMRAIIQGCPDMEVDAGKHVRLRVKGSLVMSDTGMERRDNREAVSRAEGDVLIAGLGIGLMLIPVALRDSVRSVTVLESSMDVIDLVWPKVADHLRVQGNGASHKVEIVNVDVFDFKPRRGQKWDVIWLDIWTDQSTDNVAEINRLKQKFKGRLDRTNPKCWMGAWKEDHLRYLKRTGRWR